MEGTMLIQSAEEFFSDWQPVWPSLTTRDTCLLATRDFSFIIARLEFLNEGKQRCRDSTPGTVCFSASSQPPELGHQKGTATLGWCEKGSHAVCTTHSLSLDLGLWKMAKKQRFKGFSWLWKSVVEQGSSHVVEEGEGREGKEKTKEPRLDDSLASFYSIQAPSLVLPSPLILSDTPWVMFYKPVHFSTQSS